MRSKNLISLCGGLIVACSLLVATGASAASFTAPVKLVGTNANTGAPDPTSGPFGGEPSIAADPLGHVYVSSPVGIPSGLSGTPGVGFWISNDDGNTFSTGKYIGTFAGGGDSDVIVANTPKPNSVFSADLEAAATDICLSTDYGKTFTGAGPFPDPSNCTVFHGGQAGPSDDREWLTYDPKGNHIYLTYHEFVSAQPIAFRSDNGGGDDFANPCGPLVTDPAIESNVPQDITGGTLVARPVVDKNGTLYVLFATTTQQENAAAAANQQPSGTFSQLYLAVSKDNCQSFTDYTVFDGEGKYGENKVQFGDVFNNLAIDGAGNLYVVGTGFVNTPSNTATPWVLSSSDGGQHWTSPMQLDSPQSAYMLPAAVGGPGAGQLAIGYFRTTNGKTDPNDSSGQWTYSTAESSNANSPSPTFAYGDVNPGYVYHKGEICNLGILCGNVPGGPSDRSLLDFTSVTLDPSGCPLYVFAGNPPSDPVEQAAQNDPNNPTTLTWNYVTRQTSSCFSASTSGSTTTGSGNGAHPPHHPKPMPHAKHKKHKRHAKRHRRHKRHGKRHARHRAALDFAG